MFVYIPRDGRRCMLQFGLIVGIRDRWRHNCAPTPKAVSNVPEKAGKLFFAPSTLYILLEKSSCWIYKLVHFYGERWQRCSRSVTRYFPLGRDQNIFVCFRRGSRIVATLPGQPFQSMALDAPVCAVTKPGRFAGGSAENQGDYWVINGCHLMRRFCEGELLTPISCSFARWGVSAVD